MTRTYVCIQVSFDLVEKYLEEHGDAWMTWGKGKTTSSWCGGFRENALFQDYHGLKCFRTAMAAFMEHIRGGRATFDPDRLVLTAGATAANELLTFILANPGDALLLPTPYYPGYHFHYTYTRALIHDNNIFLVLIFFVNFQFHPQNFFTVNFGRFYPLTLPSFDEGKLTI